MSYIWTISPEYFEKKILEKDTILIDIRTPQEKIDHWYINNTDLFMDMYWPTFWDDILELDKSKKYLIYCWHANRSAFLLKFMGGNWFESVYDLWWWIDLWEREWFEVKKD